MAAEYELTLNDYLSIIRRRATHMGVAFAVILGAAVAVAVGIPPVYQSTGTILVESQQIPTDFVQASGTSLADERIEVIKQRVMTRENLLRIIDKYKFFANGGGPLTSSEKIDEMRNQIVIELLSANVKGNRKGQTTIAFKLSFQHRNPEIAYRVANELVTLFLDENVKSRTERASETTEFLTQEADKLKVELENLENQLATYKQRHGNALPEHMQLRMNMASRTESEIKDVERDYKAAQEELRFLEVELSAARSGLASRAASASSASAAPSPAQELNNLKTEYAKLLAAYKEAHPDVRALKRKIEALEAAGPAPVPVSADKGNSEAINLDVARVQAKIAAANSRINSLAAQSRSLRAKLGAYESEIIRTPQVERGLITLMRDHENAQKKYEEIRAKQMSAQITENLEQENKAERFSLLEPPLMPDAPIKPDRMKIMLVGLFVAMGGSGGMAFLLESMNQRIRGAGALALLMRQRPLVSIPYITTQYEIVRRRRRTWMAVIAVVLAILVAAVLVHFLYMPLDVLMLKLAARFG